MRANLKIKIANKQSVGLETPSSQQVLFVAGSVWTCAGGVTVNDALVRELSRLMLRCYLPIDLLRQVASGELGEYGRMVQSKTVTLNDATMGSSGRNDSRPPSGLWQQVIVLKSHPAVTKAAKAQT